MVVHKKEILQYCGKVLKCCRQKRGLTQKSLANLSGVSQQDICRLENGYNNPKIATFIAILNAMDFDFHVVDMDEAPSTEND